MSRIKDLRMKLTAEEIKNVLAKFGVFSVEENDNEIIDIVNAMPNGKDILKGIEGYKLTDSHAFLNTKENIIY